jgi:hypothetical protein
MVAASTNVASILLRGIGTSPPTSPPCSSCAEGNLPRSAGGVQSRAAPGQWPTGQACGASLGTGYP